MKKGILLITLIFAGMVMVTAQQKQPSVTIAFPNHMVEFFAQPANANSKTLPLIQAKTKANESFGLSFQGVDGNSSVIELLDSTGKMVKAISVNELLGKTSNKGVKLLSSTVAGSFNRSENEYEIASPQGKYSVVVTSLATSGRSTKEAPAKMLIRIVLKNQPKTISSTRVILPFDGIAETKVNGFILSGKKSTQPMFASVFPKAEKLTVEKKNIVVTTKVLKTDYETIALLLSFDCTNTKEEAAAALLALDQKSEINISIVSVSNATTAKPTDTVSYQIICTNIGTGGAKDIVISNPVSAGTQYLEGSAVGNDTQITFDRASAVAPGQGEVKTINWKMTKVLNVGEEKIVSFKVIVQ